MLRQPAADLDKVRAFVSHYEGQGFVTEQHRGQPMGGLPARSSAALARLMLERGIPLLEVERGLSYADEAGAKTVRKAYILAMSRIMFSDAELSAGARFEND